MENTSATTMGILYVVATPIGNLEDISARAVHVLKSVDAVLAEDTRHSLKLFQALGIEKNLMSLHDHNEAAKCKQIIERLKKGSSLALISDAGTPLISDPGFILVREARAAGLNIVPIPGPSALITALSAAGVPCDVFTFAGFLPAKETARMARLQALFACEHTVIVYESSHRIENTVANIVQLAGEEYEFVLAKELTKTFETILHAKSREIQSWLQADARHVKGEFVLILPSRHKADTQSEDEKLLHILLTELPLKQAVKLAAQISATPKNELYKTALEIKDCPSVRQ